MLCSKLMSQGGFDLRLWMDSFTTTLAKKVVTAEKFMRLIYSSIMWYRAILSFGSTSTRPVVSARRELALRIEVDVAWYHMIALQINLMNFSAVTIFLARVVDHVKFYSKAFAFWNALMLCTMPLWSSKQKNCLHMKCALLHLHWAHKRLQGLLCDSWLIELSSQQHEVNITLNINLQCLGFRCHDYFDELDCHRARMECVAMACRFHAPGWDLLTLLLTQWHRRAWKGRWKTLAHSYFVEKLLKDAQQQKEVLILIYKGSTLSNISLKPNLVNVKQYKVKVAPSFWFLNINMPIFCWNRFQTVSARRGSNFLAVHRQNVDQIACRFLYVLL